MDGWIVAVLGEDSKPVSFWSGTELLSVTEIGSAQIYFDKSEARYVKSTVQNFDRERDVELLQARRTIVLL